MILGSLIGRECVYTQSVRGEKWLEKKATKNGRRKKEKYEVRRTERLGEEWDDGTIWDQLEVIKSRRRGSCSEDRAREEW